MAWRRPGDKPLSETMMVSSPTHKCVTRPQWVKYRVPVDFINCHLLRSTGLKLNITLSSKPSGACSKDKTPSNSQKMLSITKIGRYSMTDGACVPKRFPKKCTFGKLALVLWSVGTKQLTNENVVSRLRQIGKLNWCKNLMTVVKRDQILSTLLVAL